MRDDGDQRPPTDPRAHRGRGARLNTGNRFTQLEVDLDLEEVSEDDLRVKTRYLDDTSRSAVATNNSPDIGFDVSINPYRGCEHGCSYCYARPTHEYLGFSAGLDFERVILVKRDAARLLEERLRSPKWKPQVIAISGVTDPYQPIERKLGITRSVLEALARFRNPVGLITKNELVTRDIDVLAEMAAWNGASVSLSVTTLDEGLRAKLEPRTSTITNRLRAIRRLAEAGVPVGVNVAPIIPGLTDHEVPEILAAAAEAGARHAGYTVLRLPGAVAQVFEEWLESNYGMRKDKVLNRVREAHDGRLADPMFGRRMKGSGEHANQVRELFHLTCKRVGLDSERTPLATDSFRVPGYAQQPRLF